MDKKQPNIEVIDWQTLLVFAISTALAYWIWG